MLKISQDEFDSLVNERIEEVKNLLLIKSKEYVRNNDPLHNFNVTGNYNKEHPAKSLHGMLSKHLTSYLDMLDDIQNEIAISDSKIKEKFGDIIVYFILQEVLFYTNNRRRLSDLE